MKVGIQNCLNYFMNVMLKCVKYLKNSWLQVLNRTLKYF